MRSTATISPCGTYRYMLRRIWDEALPPCYWIMLNPSTADAEHDDPTIRRVVAFSRGWGFGSANVVNLFAIRGTDPAILSRTAIDRVGPNNDATLESIPHDCKVVAAWGSSMVNFTGGRAIKVRQMFKDRLSCLGRTRDGHPRHPLYVRADTELQQYPHFGGGDA